MIIPLQGVALLSGAPVGFGSSDGSGYVDYQRGSLIYRLDGPNGFELVTRGSSLVTPDPAAQAARGGTASLQQVVSVVDIPANAPLGTHALYVAHRYTDPTTNQTLEEPGPDYNGSIRILPPSIDVPLAGGGTETVVGSPTPFELFLCVFGNCSWNDATPNLPHVVPNPQIQIGFSTQGTAEIWSLELELTYPASVIDIQDAYETPIDRLNHRALVWYTDDPAAGLLQVSAVADGAKLGTLSIAFDLDDGATAVLDPAQLGVTVTGAWDGNGQPLSVTTSAPAIF